MKASRYVGIIALGLLVCSAAIGSLGAALDVSDSPWASGLLGALLGAPLSAAVALAVAGRVARPQYLLQVTVAVFMLGGTGLLSLVAMHAELRFPFRPEIDTRLAPGFSQAAFAEITAGMSEGVVRESLGRPLYVTANAGHWPGAPDAVWSYAGDGACGWCDCAWHARDIGIKNGVVLWVQESWRYD